MACIPCGASIFAQSVAGETTNGGQQTASPWLYLFGFLAAGGLLIYLAGRK